MPKGNSSGANEAVSPGIAWGTDSGFTYVTDATGSQYQMFTRFESANNLRCELKNYTAKFGYPFFSTGGSFCSGTYATSNANLYVVSSN